jgi:hypothetical protein
MVVFVESAGEDFIKRMTVFEHKNNSFSRKIFLTYGAGQFT